MTAIAAVGIAPDHAPVNDVVVEAVVNGKDGPGPDRRIARVVLAAGSLLSTGMFLRQVSNTLHRFSIRQCRRLVKFRQTL